MLQIKKNIPSSPAFIIDKQQVLESFERLKQLKQKSGCKLLYSIKALPLTEILCWGIDYVDGYSVSSLFEARLADAVLAGQGSLHLTTPGLKVDEMSELSRRCQFISFNSMTQLQYLKPHLHENCSLGLRVNPQLSFVNDERYDPCRLHSKLGVPLSELNNENFPEQIQGLHVHTVFACTDFAPLLNTVAALRAQLGKRLKTLQWLNLGGGYLFNEINEHSDFIYLVKQLRQELNVDIYIEPGNAIVNAAGYLLATVVDVFNSDGKTIAILDSSVNHNPEVFEYQLRPELCEHKNDAEYAVILAGCTCLAGDVFGEYRFEKPLQVGDSVMFSKVGAYSLIKANRFNGYNLPDIYAYQNQQLDLLKQYPYRDYLQQWSVEE